ncbi:hypothetical protein ACOMHN_014519 [Nucella lapillus]
MFSCNPFKGRCSRDQRRRRGEDWGEAWRVKVVVVGDGRCGKTCLIRRHCQGTLPLTYTPTLFDTTTTTSLVKERKVQVVIQDTAGQEDLDRLRPPFYMYTDVIIVCFSPTDDSADDSWDRVRKVWIPEARRYCGKHVPILLVANKVDVLSSPVGDLPYNSRHLEDCHDQVNNDFGVDPLKRSAGALRHCDNPAFRDCHCTTNTQEDVTEKRSSADSGIFGSTEDLAPLGLFEEKRSLLVLEQNGSRTDHMVSKTRRQSRRQSISDAVDKLRPMFSVKNIRLLRGGGGQSCSTRQQKGHSLASQIGAVGYFETSAFLHQGIDQVFQAAVTAAIGSKKWRKRYRL